MLLFVFFKQIYVWSSDQFVSFLSTSATSPPKFVKEIKDITVIEGKSATFTAEITGMPRPEVTWYKNYREVFSGRHYEVKQDGTTYTLVIKKTGESDIGGIECSVKNKFGSATSRAMLDVEGIYSAFYFIYITLLIWEVSFSTTKVINLWVKAKVF